MALTVIFMSGMGFFMHRLATLETNYSRNCLICSITFRIDNVMWISMALTVIFVSGMGFFMHRLATLETNYSRNLLL